jgi:hypothetical protein
LVDYAFVLQFSYLLAWKSRVLITEQYNMSVTLFVLLDSSA